MGILESIGTGATISVTIQAIDKFSSVFKEASLAGKALTGLAAGVTTGGIALASLGVSSLKVAADFEQTQLAFTTMLGSADEAQKLLKKLADFAKNTPFTLTGIENQTKKLLAYGIDSKEVMGDLKALGDIAAGVGIDKLPQLTLAFGQVSAKGRLMGQELNQFTEAGVPLLDELAKSMGKPKSEIQDMVSAGEVGFEDVKNALVTLTSEGGRFEDLMSKQSETVAGKFSNLQDTFELMQREIGVALLPIISKLADVFQNQVLPAIQPLIPVIADLLAFGLKGLIDIITPLIPLVIQVAEEILKSATEAMPSLLDSIQEIVPVLSDLITTLLPLIPAAIKLIAITLDLAASLINFLEPAIAPILWILQQWIDLIKNVVDWISTLIGWVKELVNWLAKVSLDTLSSIASFGGKVFGGSSTRKVNDFIMRPNGQVIETHPNDTIIGTKNPEGLGGGMNIIIEGNIYGTDPDQIAEALYDKLRRKISL